MDGASQPGFLPTEGVVLLKLDPVALTDVGRKRDHNEDFVGDLIIRSGKKYGPEKLAERGYLFAVADGMGGHASGEVASEMAVTTLFEKYYNGPVHHDHIASDLMQAIKGANYEVFSAGNASGKGQMGTTLTLALIKGNRALVGNVGDSRTYLIRQGIPERITRDHSLVQDQIDMGAITPEQAEHSMIKNVITRAIGHRDVVEPDLFERELREGDVLLLCSDGLHGFVQEVEMGTIVATAKSLKDAAKELVDLANSRGGPDNITVFLVGIVELGEPITAFLSNNANTVAATVPMRLDEETAEVRIKSGDYTDQVRSSDATDRVRFASADYGEQPTTPMSRELNSGDFTEAMAEKPTNLTTPTVAKSRRGGRLLPTLLGLIALVIIIGVVLVIVANNTNTTTTAPAGTPNLSSPARTTAAAATAPATTNAPGTTAGATTAPVTTTGSGVNPPSSSGDTGVNGGSGGGVPEKTAKTETQPSRVNPTETPSPQP